MCIEYAYFIKLDGSILFLGNKFRLTLYELCYSSEKVLGGVPR